jgi:hypothetical protein
VDSATAKVVADRIKILGDYVMIYSLTDMSVLCHELADRDIAWDIRTEFQGHNDDLKIYPATLWWDHTDPVDQHNLPHFNSNIITNKSFNTSYPYDLVTDAQIESLNLNNCVPGVGQEEISTIWPDIYNKYHSDMGFINGTPIEPHSFIHVNTYNVRQQVQTLVAQGAKRIIVDQLLEGAIIDFYIKAQLVAWSCRDFIEPHNFIITTSVVGAADAWKTYCEDNDITDGVRIMECNVSNSWCAPSYPDIQRFNDTEYDINKTHDKLFTSLNAGILRRHRYALGVELMEQDIFHKGIVSFSDYSPWIPKNRPSGLQHGSQQAQEKFKDVMPVWIDIEGGTTIDQIIAPEQSYLYDSYFSIVTETQFYGTVPDFFMEHYMLKDTVFRTEKTMRPMWFRHPFITMGVQGYMQVLRDQGYKTFHPYINEDYDSEPDDHKRLCMVVAEAKRLCAFTDSEWLAWKANVAPIVEHNYNWIQHNDTPISYNDYEYLFEEKN